MEEKGLEFKKKIFAPLFFSADTGKPAPFYVYFNVTTPEMLRKVLEQPQIYAPSGVYTCAFTVRSSIFSTCRPSYAGYHPTAGPRFDDLLGGGMKINRDRRGHHYPCAARRSTRTAEHF